VKRLAIAIASLALLSGCGSGTLAPRVEVIDVRKDAAHPPTYSGMSLKNGQVILSEAPEATSFAFSLIPDQFYDFTHAGIVAIEDGEAWVYEASGALATVPLHSKVLDNVSGQVNRRPLFEYVAPNLYAEIFDPPEGVDGNKAVTWARGRYADKTPFDAYFRWEEHETLFCTELVELAMRAGGGTPHTLGGIRFQPSLDLGLRWLGVQNQPSLPAGLWKDESRYVAAMGQFPTRANAYAYFAAKRELYRRFHHQDQRLGYLFTMKGTGEINLRPEIADFVVNASHLFDGVSPQPEPTNPIIVAAVRRYADAVFGPVPD
jgi:hypothetical protein